MMKHIGHGQDAVIILERRYEMLIYISGAITNDPYYRRKFETAKTWLMKKGHAVINPAEVADTLPILKHDQYMHIDKSLIDICDAVYFLKDWGSSRGAKEEYNYIKIKNIARNHKIKMFFEGDNDNEL